MKKRSIAALLALFLGTLGIHRFYLRSPISGVFYIVITIFVTPLASAFFNLIEFLYYVFVSDATFNETYNKDMNDCINCGKLIGKDDRACRYCGYVFFIPAPRPCENQKPSASTSTESSEKITTR